jgi:hypothetical protein
MALASDPGVTPEFRLPAAIAVRHVAADRPVDAPHQRSSLAPSPGGSADPVSRRDSAGVPVGNADIGTWRHKLRTEMLNDGVLITPAAARIANSDWIDPYNSTMALSVAALIAFCPGWGLPSEGVGLSATLPELVVAWSDWLQCARRACGFGESSPKRIRGDHLPSSCAACRRTRSGSYWE